MGRSLSGHGPWLTLGKQPRLEQAAGGRAEVPKESEIRAVRRKTIFEFSAANWANEHVESHMPPLPTSPNEHLAHAASRPA